MLACSSTAPQSRGMYAGSAAARTYSSVAAHVKNRQRQRGPGARDGACKAHLLSAAIRAPRLSLLQLLQRIPAVSRTSPARLLLPNMRTDRLGQTVASSFGSVPVMELFRILNHFRLLRLAHAVIGSVPVCQHPYLRLGSPGCCQRQHTHTFFLGYAVSCATHQLQESCRLSQPAQDTVMQSTGLPRATQGL